MKYIRILCVILVLTVLFAGCKKQEQPAPQPAETQPAASSETLPEPTRPALAVTQTREEGETVIVTTTFGTVSYPFAFADMLGVTAEENKLVFAAHLEEDVPVYTILFEDKGSITLGSLYFPQTQETLPVTAELMQLPDGMEESQSSFYAVQETFNDVVNSLEVNENFTAAE